MDKPILEFTIHDLLANTHFEGFEVVGANSEVYFNVKPDFTGTFVPRGGLPQPVHLSDSKAFATVFTIGNAVSWSDTRSQESLVQSLLDGLKQKLLFEATRTLVLSGTKAVLSRTLKRAQEQLKRNTGSYATHIFVDQSVHDDIELFGIKDKVLPLNGMTKYAFEELSRQDFLHRHLAVIVNYDAINDLGKKPIVFVQDRPGRIFFYDGKHEAHKLVAKIDAGITCTNPYAVLAACLKDPAI